jgi:hypothetical protein
MPKTKSRKKKPPKRVLALPDLELAKTAVPNRLTSASGAAREADGDKREHPAARHRS